MAKTKIKKNGAVEKKLVGLADMVIASAQRAKDPTMEIPLRALSNVTFNSRKGLLEMGSKKQARSFFNVGMAKKFMQTMLVADALSELQRAELTTSLREIYYRTKHTIQDSHENTFDTRTNRTRSLRIWKCRSWRSVRSYMCARRTAGVSSARSSSEMTETAWIAPSSERVVTRSRRLSSLSMWRSAVARRTLCYWSRKARSGIVSRQKTSSGVAIIASC